MNNKEEKKKMLLEAAYEVFLEFGPHKTTLNDIARRAGMANTSLYYYFGSKDEIISAVIMNEQKRFFEMLSKAIQGHDTAEAKMCSLVEAHYHFITNRVQNASEKAILEHLSLFGIFEPNKDNYIQPLQHFILLILQEGIEKGEFRPLYNLDLISQVITFYMKGCNYLFVLHINNEQILKIIKQTVRAIFTGLIMKNLSR